MAVNRRQVSEIVKCGKDPLYFFNTYCKIQHPIRGLIPFHTYPFQDDCIQAFIDHRLNVILKARQMGISTLVAAYCTWLALFHKDQNLLIIATKQSVAQNIIRKVKVILYNLPKWLILPSIETNNKQSIEFSNGSRIEAMPTSDDVGRSEGVSLLIVDEAAHIRNFDDLWTGLWPTLSTGGRTIILSTPKGVGGQFHKIYTEAEAGLNEFNPIMLPWYVHPERDDKWFESETRNFSKRRIAQEYLCDFLASGETLLDADDIEWIGSLIKLPRNKFGLDRNGWEWEIPLDSHYYIISADVSRGDRKDYSAFHVFDMTDGRIVAEYKGKLRPDNFSDLLEETGYRYNTALIVPENNTYGYYVCSRLREHNYPKLYYHDDKRSTYLGDYIPPRDVSKAGFPTTAKTRPIILAKMEELIRNKQIEIYSSRFYNELKQFVWKDGKAQAQKGANDDLVMSFAIGCWFYDGAGDYGKYSIDLNQAMLNAMDLNRKKYESTQIRGTGKHFWNPFVLVSSGEMLIDHRNENIQFAQKVSKNLSWLY